MAIAEGIPRHVHQALFCWERGDKLQSTEPQPVDHATASVAWDETLRQVRRLHGPSQSACCILHWQH